MTDTDQAIADSTAPTDETRQSLESAFIASLKRLDSGRLAQLRRNAGKDLAEARGAAWFYGLLGQFARGYDEEAFFLVATLFAFDKDAQKRGTTYAGNFGATLRALRDRTRSSDSNNHPLDRRFGLLLDSDFNPDGTGGELAFRLRQMVKQVIAKKDPNVRIDWPQLLADIRHWGSDRKYVQKKWARSYYAPALPEQADDSQQDQAST